MEQSQQQSSTQGFYVFADDPDSLGSGKTGLTLVITLSKDGGTVNAVTSAQVEIGNGWYFVTPDAAHRDTLGRLLWQFSATGAVISGRVEKIVAVNDQTEDLGVSQSIWTHGQRTLTQSQPASQDMGLNSRLNLLGGYDWSIPLTLGDLGDWTQLWFTVKDDLNKADDAATVSIKLTNPGDDGDGLQLLNGADAIAEDGSITVVDSDTGEIWVDLKAIATVKIDPNSRRFYYWDVKRLVGSKSAPPTGTGGVITVARATTRAV